MRETTTTLASYFGAASAIRSSDAAQRAAGYEAAMRLTFSDQPAPVRDAARRLLETRGVRVLLPASAQLDVDNQQTSQHASDLSRA